MEKSLLTLKGVSKFFEKTFNLDVDSVREDKLYLS